MENGRKAKRDEVVKLPSLPHPASPNDIQAAQQCLALLNGRMRSRSKMARARREDHALPSPHVSRGCAGSSSRALSPSGTQGSDAQTRHVNEEHAPSRNTSSSRHEYVQVTESRAAWDISELVKCEECGREFKAENILKHKHKCTRICSRKRFTNAFTKDLQPGIADFVHVTVRTFSSGQVLEEYLRPGTTVHELKDIISHKWQVPNLCMKLSCGDKIMNDAVPVNRYCTDDKTLPPLMMFVSLEGIGELLNSGDIERELKGLRNLELLGVKGGRAAAAALRAFLQRGWGYIRTWRAALHVFAQVAEKDNSEDIATVIGWIEDGRPMMASVRQAAIFALTKLVKKGSPQATAALTALAEDGDQHVRRDAVDALANIADQGDESAISVMVALSADEAAAVRQAAVAALPRTAERCDEVAITAIRARLASNWNHLYSLTGVDLQLHRMGVGQTWENKDKDWNVRKTAVEAFGQIAHKGNNETITVILYQFDDEASCVREAAVRALMHLFEKDEKEVIDALIGCLNHLHSNVRSTAVHALATLAKKGNKDAIAAARAALEDEAPDVRHAAVEALAQLAERGDKQTMAVVRGCIEDEEPMVQQSAVMSLAKIAENGDNRAVGLLSNCVKDKNPIIQQAALHALAQIARKGSPEAIGAAGACLKDRKGDVRQAAVHVLASVSQKGNPVAVAALRACLKDKMNDVRKDAARALVHITKQCDQETMDALAACFEDRVPDVRQAAIQSFAHIAHKGDKKAIAAVVSCLLDGRETVRQVALKALAHMAESGDKYVRDIVMVHLDDEAFTVRDAAVQTLSQVAKKGDRDVVHALCARLGDKDQSVCLSAAQAFAQVAEKGDKWTIATVTAGLEGAERHIGQVLMETLRQIT